MKKIIAILLCLALALGCTAALAETAEKATLGVISMNGAFELHGVIPEGYQLETLTEDPGRYVAVLQADDTRPTMVISIAYEELMSGIDRLNDLDDDALAKIEATFRAEDGVEISYMETAQGTKLMVVKEVVEGVDFVDFYTIYKGYEVEFVLTWGLDAGPITDEQIQTAVQFLSDLDFVAIEDDEDEFGFYTDDVPEALPYYSTWVAENGDWRIEVFSEDGGMKLMAVHKLGGEEEDVWEYSALMTEDRSALAAMPFGLHYLQNTATGNWVETYYEDGDAIFTLDGGKLLWNDLKEDAGKGLAFEAVGNYFGGRWMKGDVEVVFQDWRDGQYDIRLRQRGENGEILREGTLKGVYDPAADAVNAAGGFEGGEAITVTFSYSENRDAVVWTENGESTVMDYSYYVE